MISLTYDNTTRLPDIGRTDGNIELDHGFSTAVLISIFTRRLALNDDDLPDPQGHREGWWADPYADVEGDLIGSRLWLLRRSKTTQETLNQARIYLEECLQWMIDDGIASEIVATVERQTSKEADGRLAFRVEITKPDDPKSRWISAWTAHLEEF